MKNELIKIETREGFGRCVSLRELHEGLKIKSKFNDFAKRMCGYGFEDNIDYIKATKKVTLNNEGKNRAYNEEEYIITIDMAKEICMIQRRNKMAGELLEYLIKKDNREVMVLTKHTTTRFELSFGEQLQETLKPLGIKIEVQKSIFNGKYRIDFYLPEYKLAIEYDEEQHNNDINRIKDKQREEEIKNELHCDFIRLNYKDTDAYNVGLVLKKIFNR